MMMMMIKKIITIIIMIIIIIIILAIRIKSSSSNKKTVDDDDDDDAERSNTRCLRSPLCTVTCLRPVYSSGQGSVVYLSRATGRVAAGTKKQITMMTKM